MMHQLPLFLCPSLLCFSLFLPILPLPGCPFHPSLPLALTPPTSNSLPLPPSPSLPHCLTVASPSVVM
uniref:Putative secreted protein n=1 Tax=Ixodes ricinus TaxID=34613 RepID=A0A6B0TQQ1_IXORI